MARRYHRDCLAVRERRADPRRHDLRRIVGAIEPAARLSETAITRARPLAGERRRNSKRLERQAAQRAQIHPLAQSRRYARELRRSSLVAPVPRLRLARHRRDRAAIAPARARIGTCETTFSPRKRQSQCCQAVQLGREGTRGNRGNWGTGFEIRGAPRRSPTPARHRGNPLRRNCRAPGRPRQDRAAFQSAARRRRGSLSRIAPPAQRDERYESRAHRIVRRCRDGDRRL